MAPAMADHRQQTEIVIGISDRIKTSSNLTELSDANKTLIDLHEQLELDVELKLYHDVDKLVADIENGVINGALAPTGEILSHADTFDFDNVLFGIKVLGNQDGQRMITLVRASDNIKSLAELRGKKLSIFSHTNLEHYYLNTMLYQQFGIPDKQFFSDISIPKTIHKAILDVFFGITDVAIVRASEFAIATELNPQVGKKLIAINQSPIVTFLVCALGKHQQNDVLGPEIAAFVHKLNAHPKGKEILRSIYTNELKIMTADDLKNDIMVMRGYNKAKKKANK